MKPVMSSVIAGGSNSARARLKSRKRTKNLKFGIFEFDEELSSAPPFKLIVMFADDGAVSFTRKKVTCSA